MSLYLLDTDTLSLLQQRHPAVSRRYRATPRRAVAVAVITVQEQLMGWYGRLPRAKRPDEIAWAYEYLTRAIRFLTRMNVVTFTEPAAYRFQTLLAMRLNIGKMDLRIAATALECGAVVVTRNLRDFGRVPNLTVEDWTV